MTLFGQKTKHKVKTTILSWTVVRRHCLDALCAIRLDLNCTTDWSCYYLSATQENFSKLLEAFAIHDLNAVVHKDIIVYQSDAHGKPEIVGFEYTKPKRRNQ